MTGSGTLIDPWDWNTAISSRDIVHAGDVLTLRSGIYTSPATPVLIGQPDDCVTIRAYPGERVIFDGMFSVATDYLQFEHIEFCYSGWTSRVSAFPGSAPEDIPIVDANLRGNHNRYIGCLFHDLRGGCLWYTVGGEMHDCLSFFHGWQGPDRKHGHAYYTHNGATSKRMVNCMAFDSFGYGVALYSASESLSNVEIKNCAFFGSGRLPTGGDNYNLHAGGEAGVECDSLIIDGCIVYDGSQTRIGYNGGATNVHLLNNSLSGGINDANADIVEDFGNDMIANTDLVKVTASEVIPGRANIIIKNVVALADSITVNVSPIMQPGDSYTLRNARDYWVDVVTGTVADDGMIAIDMRSASHTIATPVTLSPISSGFPGFGAFVLQKQFT